MILRPKKVKPTIPDLPSPYPVINEQNPNQPTYPKEGFPPFDIGLECRIPSPELGICRVTAKEINEMLGRTDIRSDGWMVGYLNPYTKEPIVMPDGTYFCRIRLDFPHKYADGTEAKYLSKANSGQMPYFPPTADFTKGGEELWITEGEKKAFYTTSKGKDTVGLSGNYGWKVSGKNRILPELLEIIQKYKIATLIWDSDAALNPSFSHSTYLFAKALGEHGIKLKVLSLAPEGYYKVGADDYLKTHSMEELSNLVEKTPFIDTGKVTERELLLALCSNIKAFLNTTPYEIVSSFLSTQFRKGFIDSTRHEDMLAVLTFLNNHTAFDIFNFFKQKVNSFVLQKYPNAAQSKKTFKAGDKVKNKSNKKYEVIESEQFYVWVKNKAGKSQPIPAGELEVYDPIAAAVADEIYHELFQGGLKYWREAWWQYGPPLQGGYVELPDADILAAAMTYIRKNYSDKATPGFQKAVIANLQSYDLCYLKTKIEPPVKVVDGDTIPQGLLIPFTNLTFNLDAYLKNNPNHTIENTPEVFAITGRNNEYDPKATSPIFDRFRKEILPDPELRDLLQEMFGYLQVANTEMQKIFLFYGQGANGKSVLCNILTALLGKNNVCSVPLSKMGERFALWPLTIKLANIVSEIPVSEPGQGHKNAEDKLKAISAGDNIEIERKHKDVVTAAAIARLVFSANELPYIYDRSNGTWRRFIFIPFKVTIPEEKQDRTLTRRIIKSELPGIFNWAIEGYARLIRRGHFLEPEICKKIKEEHRSSCSPELEFFNDYVEATDSSEFTSSSALYDKYKMFIYEQGGKPLGGSNFKKAVLAAFPNTKHTKRKKPYDAQKRGFTGLKLLKNERNDNE